MSDSNFSRSFRFYFICGSTGAGKTTYSEKLAAQTQGVRLPIDEFMKTLFWMDAPETPSFEWTEARVNRCENLIMSLCEKWAPLEQPIVLDLGFSEKKGEGKVSPVGDSERHSIRVALPRHSETSSLAKSSAAKSETRFKFDSSGSANF